MTEAQPEAKPRNPFGWIVLALLFAFQIFSANTREPSQSTEARLARYATRLRSAMATYQAGDSPIVRLMTGEQSADAPLRKIVRDAAPKRRTDFVDAAAWGAARSALGEPVEQEVLARLASTTSKDDPLIEAFRGGERTAAESQALAKRLERRGPISKAMAEEVLRQAGVAKVGNAGKLAAGAFIVLLVLASGAAWLVTAILGVSGYLNSLGPATKVKNGSDADLLALRAATLFATFYALSLGAGALVSILGLSGLVAQVLVFGPMLLAVPLVLRAGPGMAGVGLTTQNLGRNVLLGLWAFLLELPVTGLIAIVCSVLLRNLPTPEHPASTALMGSPSFWTIAVTFFGGAIAAPFWEETMFRGLLFPALRHVLRFPVVAALASSFLFASIHPQGPVLWAALASVALFSCFLAQKTGSLVPSVVMHFAHNATLLTLAVTMGG